MTNQLQDSMRREDENEYLHIDECILTGEEVAEYLGKEIQGYTSLGIEPDEIVPVLRPGEEIQRAADTFNNIPLTDNHIAISPTRPNQSKWLGCTGSKAYFKDGKLYNSVSLWTQRAKDYISKADNGSGGKKDLSCGYAYDLVPEQGVFNGKPYKFKMVNLRGNHLALVEEGRNPDAMIADSKLKTEGKKVKKTLAQILLGAFIGDSKKTTKIDALKEVLAMDSAEFPGGAEAQLDNVRDMLKHMANDEMGRQDAFAQKDIEDEEPEDKEDKKVMDKKAKDKKAKDEECDEDKKAEDGESPEDIIEDEEEEETKAEKAMDAAIRTRDKVIALCNSVVGKMSDKFIADSSPEQMISATLKKFNLNTAGKSLETQVAMLETLSATRKTKTIAKDSAKVSSDYKSIIPNRRG